MNSKCCSSLRLTAAVAGVIACIALPGPGARAAVITWDGAPGATFNTPGSWVNNAIPQAGDTAQFNTAATAVFDNSPTNAGLTVSANNVSFQASGATRTYAIAGTTNISGATLSLSSTTREFFLQNTTLNVFSAGSLLVNASTHVSATTFNLATTGGGTAGATISGVNASLVVTGLATIGNSAATANLIFQNNATGSFAGLDINGALSTAAAANMTVSGGAHVTASGNVTLGNATQAGQISTLLITGAGSSFSQTGNVSLTIGAASGTDAATLTLASGGVYSTGVKPAGTPTVTINRTGTLHISASSTFNSHGDFTVDGGTVVRDNGGIFNLDSGATFTAANNAQVTFNDFFDVFNNTTLRVQSGAHFSGNNYVDVGDGSAGTLIVDGTGSAFITSNDPYWGINGGSANVTISNGAAMTISSTVSLGAGATAGTAGVATVQTGATLAVNDIYLATSGGNIKAILTLTDANSSITQAGASGLTIGGASGTATLNVNNSATFNSGSGLTSINPAGILALGGGTYNAKGVITLNGGRLLINSGDFNLNSGASLAPGAAATSLVIGQASGAAANLNVNTGGNFNTAAFTLNPTGAINVSGGIYNLNGVLTLNGGSVHVNSGTLNLNAAGALTTGNFTFSGAIDINGGALTASGLLVQNAGAALVFAGTPNNWNGRLSLNRPASTSVVTAVIQTTNAGDKSAKLALLANEILTGRNGGAWNGNGITAAAAAASPGSIGIGLYDNALLGLADFSGNTTTLDSHSIILASAKLGDANFDNAVNSADLNIIAANWNSHAATNWSMGDLNGDGIVDSLDVGIVLSHWTAATFAPQINYTAGFSYTLAPVPEPGSLVMLASGGLLLLRRKARVRFTH